MARKHKPVKLSKIDKHQTRVFGELTKTINRNSDSMLTVREMNFAYLIAVDGWSKSDAYREAYQPETDKDESVHVMASRMSQRPRIAAEIDRLRRKEDNKINNLHAEDSIKSVILDGDKLRYEVVKGLYMIAMNEEIEADVRIRALTALGKAKHAGVFTSPIFTVDNSNNVNNHTQINHVEATIDTVDHARGELMSRIRQMVGSPLSIESPQTIDTKALDVIEVESV